jgi:hypothetical protein
MLSNDVINIHPNPNVGVFNFNLNGLSSVIISNTLGQIIYNEILDKGQQSIDIKNQSAGLYFMKIIQNDKEQSLKIIKE